MPDVKLNDRPSYRQVAADKCAIAKDLGELCRKHGISGAVLISFGDGRVAVNSSGNPPTFAIVMDKLAARLLREIDDGKYDPDNL